MNFQDVSLLDRFPRLAVLELQTYWIQSISCEEEEEEEEERGEEDTVCIYPSIQKLILRDSVYMHGWHLVPPSTIALFSLFPNTHTLHLIGTCLDAHISDFVSPQSLALDTLLIYCEYSGFASGLLGRLPATMTATTLTTIDLAK